MPKSTFHALSPTILCALASPAHIQSVRSFNRFYTQRIGVLDSYLGSDLSLTEVRVLYELAHRSQPTASELGRALALDGGYLSRILRRFEGKGWLERVASLADARQSLLRLTPAGREALVPLEQQFSDAAKALLVSLAPAQQTRLVAAMNTVQALLTPAGQGAVGTVILRDPRPGDLGWVVQQHGEIYAREYGWNSEFEALVANIVGKYLKNYRPDCEKCWIAEINGSNAGAVFVVRKSANVAQLRMLILAPKARGFGLGARLTDEAIAFARSKGYKKMILWTNSGLVAARAIYAKRGFQLVKTEPYRGFGHDLIGETWSLRL